MRDKVQRFANRLVYGARATPYEVLSDFADRMGGTYDAADLLPMMARMVAQGVGASHVDVWLGIGPKLVREASWHSSSAEPSPALPSPVEGVASLEGDRIGARGCADSSTARPSWTGPWTSKARLAEAPG